jgi:hypothetical protein
MRLRQIPSVPQEEFSGVNPAADLPKDGQDGPVRVQDLPIETLARESTVVLL